jgi:hypothetical protein
MNGKRIFLPLKISKNRKKSIFSNISRLKRVTEKTHIEEMFYFSISHYIPLEIFLYLSPFGRHENRPKKRIGFFSAGEAPRGPLIFYNT